jgi:hypothetical protein
MMKDNIKGILEEWGGLDWIWLVQGKDKTRWGEHGKKNWEFCNQLCPY